MATQAAWLFPVNIISIVGRTCCGKSSVAGEIADKYNIPLISIGHIIRRTAQRDKGIAEAYIGKNGFSDEFIYELIVEAWEEMQKEWILLEGSVGIGRALEKLQHNGILNNSVSFWLGCSEELRRNRYQKRQHNSGRAEHQDFFEDREKLFDRKLGADWRAIRKIGIVHEIDCSPPLEVIVSKIANVLRELIDIR